MAALGADPPQASWRDRCDAALYRLIASPGFRRFAARFPLTRPIARRRARAVFDLVSGFVYSQVLLACVRLGVLELLAAQPLTVEELAGRCSLPLDGMQRLVDAAVVYASVSSDFLDNLRRWTIFLHL